VGYLQKVVRPLKPACVRLKTLLLIYRISRAPERRIFYVDVGQSSQTKSRTVSARDYESVIVTRSFTITATGQIRDERNHMSMLEDFWMPRREGGRGTEN
jgi:hypothetical protein